MAPEAERKMWAMPRVDRDQSRQATIARMRIGSAIIDDPDPIYAAFEVHLKVNAT